MQALRKRLVVVASLILLLATALPFDAESGKRSSGAVADFKRVNPCPANGNSRGPCPGWEVDHVVPLCANGADDPANMQWLTVQQHRAKTPKDRRLCAALRVVP